MQVNDLLILWSGENEYTTKPSILSTNMKVLMLVILDPDITQIAMSVTLGVSETAIEKAVANLSNHGIVAIERLGRRNRYTVNLQSLDTHRDIAALKGFLEHVQKRVQYP